MVRTLVVVLWGHLFLSSLLFLSRPNPALAGEGPTLSSGTPELIRVETNASTWRARGRVSFPLEAAIRMRLAAAGLQVASDPDSSAHAVLKVRYREERGKQVTLDIYGTEVICDFVLEQPNQGQLFTLTIRESPAYGSLSTLPYVDVIHRFETNPYFYFLGDVVRGALAGREPATSLLDGVAREATPQEGAPATDPYPAAFESLASFEPQYQIPAMTRSIEELARRQDARATPLLTRFLKHPDWRIRVQAIRGLEALNARESMPALAELARTDRESEVRHAAEQTLARYQQPTPNR